MAVKEVSGKRILELLDQGYVRFKRDRKKNETAPGSVEEELELKPADLKVFLQHDKLKNHRYKPAKVVLVDIPEKDITVLVDDFDTPDPVPTPGIVLASESAGTPLSSEPSDIPAPPVVELNEEEAQLETIMANATAEEAEIFG